MRLFFRSFIRIVRWGHGHLEHVFLLLPSVHLCVCLLAPQIRYATRAFQLPLVHRNYTEMSTQSPAVAACAK